MSYELQAKVYAIRSKDLLLSEKSVLAYLAFRADIEHRCWPSIRTIADDLGCNKDTVNLAIQSLKEKQFIFVTKNKSHKAIHNVYSLNILKIESFIPPKSVDKLKSLVRSTRTPLYGLPVQPLYGLPVLNSQTNLHTINNTEVVVEKLKAFGLPEPRIRKLISRYGIDALETSIVVRGEQTKPIDNELGWFSICLKERWKPTMAEVSNKSGIESEEIPYRNATAEETEQYIRKQEENKPVRSKSKAEYREYIKAMMSIVKVNK